MPPCWQRSSIYLSVSALSTFAFGPICNFSLQTSGLSTDSCYSLLHLFPDSRDGNESSWSAHLQELDQIALEGRGICEEEVGPSSDADNQIS